jgi:threonine dehydratase
MSGGERAPGLDDVRAAAQAMRGRVHRTPLLGSTTMTRRVGAPVMFKAELFQRTGSFKLRGALNRIRAIPADERRRGVVAMSAGNHAQGVALACAEQEVDALVLMPRDASQAKVNATRAYGATVDLDSADAGEALQRVREISQATGRVNVHPFDDPLVIAGQGTLGLEACQDLPHADTFLAPVGGGGLISGIALAVKALRPTARLVAVQPENAGTLGPSLANGTPTSVERRPTIADALAGPTVGELCLSICVRCVDEVVTVTEDEIREGMRFLYQRAKLACEPAGALPAAALLAGKLDVAGRGGVVAVVSGGNVAQADLVRALGPGQLGERRL